MARVYGEMRYAVCRVHGGDALDVFATIKKPVEIRRVNDSATYTCNCGQPAEFFLLEVTEETK